MFRLTPFSLIFLKLRAGKVMEDKELNLTEHLDELRKRLIVTVFAFLVFFILGFVFVKDIYHWLVRDLDVKLIALGPGDIIWIYFTLASVVAIAGTIPILALQLWLFVKPALRKKEQKVTLSYVPALFVLFLVGISFGYFILFPTVLGFLVDLGGDMLETNFTADKYLRFIMHLSLPMGFLFELPVVVMFLTSIGIINPIMLRRMRKYAYFILAVIAASVTPPDFISQTLVLIPLFGLYEVSVWLSSIVYKRRQRKQKEWESGYAVDTTDE